MPSTATYMRSPRSPTGIRRPQEGRWDLVFQTFLLLLLLVVGLCLAVLTLIFFMSWNIRLTRPTGGS
jgi:hypothetical protein